MPSEREGENESTHEHIYVAYVTYGVHKRRGKGKLTVLSPSLPHTRITSPPFSEASVPTCRYICELMGYEAFLSLTVARLRPTTVWGPHGIRDHLNSRGSVFTHVHIQCIHLLYVSYMYIAAIHTWNCGQTFLWFPVTPRHYFSKLEYSQDLFPLTVPSCWYSYPLTGQDGYMHTCTLRTAE